MTKRYKYTLLVPNASLFMFMSQSTVLQLLQLSNSEFKKKHFNHNSILKRLQLNKRKKKTSCQLVKKVYLGSCSNGVHTTRQFRIHSPHVYLMSYLAGILKHIHTYIHFHNKVISIILDRKGYICYVMSRSAK